LEITQQKFVGDFDNQEQHINTFSEGDTCQQLKGS